MDKPVSLSDLTDPEAVLAAMAEFRGIGRAAFLERYGFGEQRYYVVPMHGWRYDAKALVGAAHGHQHNGTPLSADDFSGGVDHANAVLEKLGFSVVDLRSWSLEDERRWRESAWEALAEGDHSPDLLREMGIYGGAQGVWVDKDRTRSIFPDGVAVAVLHTGRHYADDLDEDGVLYHYPSTRRPASRDAGEVQAVKNAGLAGLPVFVISETGVGHRRRTVKRGWVVDHDDSARVFLIDFGAVALPPPAPDEADEAPFVARARRRRSRSEVERSERDPRFKFQVLRRYQGRCVLTGLQVAEMLDAAHVIPVEEGGTDDQRNGLLLSASLHRAFDAGLWAIDPASLSVVTRPQGPTAAQMGIVKTSLSGVPRMPHQDTLIWRHDRWRQRNGLVTT